MSVAESEDQELGAAIDARRRRAARRGRRRSRADWRQNVYRAVAHLLLGLLLAGCSSTRPSLFASKEDRRPALEVLKEAKETDRRVAAYRRLDGASLSDAERSEGLQIAIQGAASEPSELGRATAVLALSTFDDPSAREAIRKAAADKSPMVRIDACHAISRRQDTEAISLLSGLVTQDKDVDVRLAAAEALAKMPDHRGATALLPCLKDRDSSVVLVARQCLKDAYQIDLGTDSKAWNQYVQDHGAPPEKVASQPFRLFR